jgi:hypothetical protein
MIFEDIVGDALLDARHGDLFSQGTRHEDEGNVRSTLLDESQSRHPIEARYRIVGNDEIPWPAVERLGEVKLGLDSLVGGFVATAPEFLDNEQGVVTRVFEDQDAKWDSHAG